MSGTSQFRSGGIGSRAGLRADTAREHLGDRLAAFVDGELGDDSRERVLSHLATCDHCKAEADEQRRLKDAVAGALPPALSAGLLARLQGLPGCPPGGPGERGSDGGASGEPLGRGGFAGLGDVFGPRGAARSYLAPVGGALDGFPIHDFDRPAASRGRRLAFVAAGAFSVAALALGVAVPLDGASDGGLLDPVGGTAATPIGVHVDGQRSAAPAMTSVAVDISRPGTSPHDVGRLPLAAPTAADRSRAPSPVPSPAVSAPVAAAPVSAGPPGVLGHATGHIARSAAPAPVPLLDQEKAARLPGPLPAPRPGTLAQ